MKGTKAKKEKSVEETWTEPHKEQSARCEVKMIIFLIRILSHEQPHRSETAVTGVPLDSISYL